MTVVERWAWLKSLWRVIFAAKELKQERFPSTGKGDIMSSISVASLDAIANAFKTAVHGKISDDIIALSEIANSIPIPQAQLIATGLKILGNVEPILEELIRQGKIKSHNTGEGGIGAAPEGNGRVQ